MNALCLELDFLSKINNRKKIEKNEKNHRLKGEKLKVDEAPAIKEKNKRLVIIRDILCIFVYMR